LKIITTDNGSEFAAHLDITAGLRMKGLPDVTVYFTDSYCSWQKGAVENVNKLIRQYIPKKSNFNNFSDEYIKNVGRKLNLRPRKMLVASTLCSLSESLLTFAGILRIFASIFRFL